MRILKSLVFFDDNSGQIYQVDTIEHEGKFWLVPEWLEAPGLGYKQPARIVCLENLRHKKTPGADHGDFVLNTPMSKAVFEGRETSAGYVVRTHPGIRVAIPRGIH